MEIETGAAGDARAAAGVRKRAAAVHDRAQAYFEHVLWATSAGEPGRELLVARGVGEELARQFGVGFAPAGGDGGDALTRYLVGRGIPVPDIVDAGLAHSSRSGGGARDRFRHRLMFPIRDAQGQTIAFGGRSLSPGDRAKYLNSPETAIYHKGSALFGIDLAKAAIATAGSTAIVEGYFDVLAAHAAGVRNVVASSGTALTPQQVSVLGRQAPLVVLCFDTDRAGRMATSRAVDLIAGVGLSCRVCIMPPGVKDLDELVRIDPAAVAEVITTAPPEWQVMIDWALAGHGGEGTEARRGATRAAVEVLQRIPEASTRALYADQVATRLRLPAAAVVDDVQRHRGPVRDATPNRGRVVATIPTRKESAVGLDDEPTGHDIAAWESYIGGVVVQRPSLAQRLLTTHGLDPTLVRSPVVRRLIEQSLTLPPDAHFPIHTLGDGDQRLAARLLLRVIPEFSPGDDIRGGVGDGDGDGDEVLDKALAQSVARVLRAHRQAELAALESELRGARDEDRESDVARLVRRKHELTTEIHRLSRH